jgi:prolipoprotein diacylglyceryltransferase
MTGRHYYSAYMFLALAVFLAARHFVPKPPALQALPWWKRAALGLAAVVGGALGAKLPFAVGAAQGPLSWSAWLSDGKTIVAGLIGGYVLVEAAKVALDVHVKTGDTFALPLALALAIGRWGCFLNGCCYGTATSLPWGVVFDVGGRPVCCHPTQVYESLFHLAMAGVLVVLLLRGLLRRHHLQLYLIVYAVYRFLSEYVRPEPIWLVGLTFYQWAALVLAAGLMVQWIVEERVQLAIRA